MKSNKRLQDKLAACKTESSQEEKYQLMASLMPNIKHLDTIKAYLHVLGIKPDSKIINELISTGAAYYHGVLQSPYSKAQIDAVMTRISLKERSNGDAELELEGKSIAQFFSDHDIVEKEVKSDPQVLSKEYKKLKNQLRESTDKVSMLEDLLQVKDDLIRSLQYHIRLLEEESLPSLGGVSKH
ncbi:MAG: hypothetical protein MJZ16_11770 [Bacteroidales bacterium]|nr:hypothetical protein [Bacteroidales bacterium]